MDHSFPAALPASKRLPNEIIEDIAHNMGDRSTLATMMQVSHRMYEIAGPRLYNEMVITQRTILSAFIDDSTESTGGNSTRVDHGEAVDSTGSSEGSPDLVQKPRIAKAKLLSMVHHLDVRRIPVMKVSLALEGLTGSNKPPIDLKPTTVCLHPFAVWELIYFDMVTGGNRTHPFVNFLNRLGIEQLCIQMPLMDQHLEDSMFPKRTAPPNHDETNVMRSHLRDAMVKVRDRAGRVRGLFGHSNIKCRHVTIHNLTLASMNRALKSFAGSNRSTQSIRIFFRPCQGSSDYAGKRIDQYCYNHDDRDSSIVYHSFEFDNVILRAPQTVELIDMDWTRGKYRRLRDRTLCDKLEGRLEKQLSTLQAAEGGNRGKKAVKMAREVETCRCCKRRQMGPARVRRSARIMTFSQAEDTELHLLRLPQVNYLGTTAYSTC